MIEVKCDECGTSLSATGFNAMRIKVSLEQIPHRGSVLLDTYIFPPLEKMEYHFCSKEHMVKYFTK